MGFLKKVQGLPETAKRVILWAIIVILALILFAVWLSALAKSFQRIEEEELKQELRLPSLSDRIKKEWQAIPFEEMEKYLEQLISEIQNATTTATTTQK